MGTCLAEISARSARHFALVSICSLTSACGIDEQVGQGQEQTQQPEPLPMEIRVNGVAPNVESTRCIKARLPNDGPLGIGRIVNDISSSSHHFVVSTIDEDKAGD